MRKGITLGMKEITGDPIIGLGPPSPAPSFYSGKWSHEQMETCLWPHDVFEGTQTSHLPAQWSKDYLIYNDGVGAHLPKQAASGHHYCLRGCAPCSADRVLPGVIILKSYLLFCTYGNTFTLFFLNDYDYKSKNKALYFVITVLFLVTF